LTRGFLIVDKPGGVTSNDVVTAVKRATRVKKVGHAGTLDPMATGVLVVGVGKVTRLIRFIQDQPKEYVATALFGVSTDTLDADGAILSRVEMECDLDDLNRLVPRFSGDILQVPPMVSALKHEGRRLYELARSGEVVEREARSVKVHELEIISVGPGPYPEVEFRVQCGKGTYVRSLAYDMASALGGVAHLTALRRMRVGSLTVDEAIGLSELPDWENHLVAPTEALRDLPQVVVEDDTADGVRHGMRFVAGDIFTQGGPGPYRVTDQEGELLAIYRKSGDWATPEVVLPA
jgi:tRNA pseudouridine55 synthase